MATAELLTACLDSLTELVLLLDAAPPTAASLSGEEAARLATSLARGEHACAAARQLCARRVAETGQYTAEGYTDAASWLAAVAGESYGRAKGELETAKALEAASSTQAAFALGEMSATKAAEVAKALKEDPSSEDDLLTIARSGTLKDLRDEVARVRAVARSAESDEKRHARIRSRRCLSVWAGEDGSLDGRFSLTPEDGAVVKGRLEKIAARIFSENRHEGVRDPESAAMADALVALCAGEDVAFAGAGESGVFRAVNAPADAVGAGESGVPAPSRTLASPPGAGGHPRRLRPDYTIVMRVDLEALLRGFLAPGEECSIDGIGPVPVALVASYLEQAKVRLVIERLTKIDSIVTFTRTIPTDLRTALEHRDRVCVVPSCQSTFHLEIDHIVEVENKGPTCLDNLCRLCHYHHRQKSESGYRIEGGPLGWRWYSPTGKLICD